MKHFETRRYEDLKNISIEFLRVLCILRDLRDSLLFITLKISSIKNKLRTIGAYFAFLYL
jgi:hypothetical protein